MAEQVYDLIRIRGWELWCILGVYDHERLRPRKIVIDLEILTPVTKYRDTLEGVVDYDALQQRIKHAVEASCFKLIESVAELIAETALSDRRVRQAKVRVGKPGALPDTLTVEVEILREQKEDIE